jgi:Right handed beta helix region
MFVPVTRRFRALVESLGASITNRGAAAATKAIPPTTNFSRESGLPLFEPLEDRTLMSTYYVNTSGSDSNSGLSGHPWKTIAKVNAASFKPGDQILFQSGQTFSGSLMLRSKVGNSTTTPVVIGTNGSGRATISSGTSDGLFDYDTSGISVQNLSFVGKPSGSQNQDGVKFESAGGGRGNISVNNCIITGYQFAGILVQGDNGTGFSGVRFTNNTIYNNVDSGIAVQSSAHNAHKNVYIGYNTVYGTYGDGHSVNTGNGIMLGDTNGAVVEHNTAHDNGAKGGNGCVGIWAYESNNVLFQYNIVYNTRSPRQLDGDGFDFDADTSNSVMQYNYAYDNDGNGFQLNQWRNDNTFTNNIVRYNVSVNNGQRHNYAGLEAWGKVLNSSFYDNVVYASPATSGGSPSGIKVHNSSVPSLYVSSLSFQNNVIVTTGGVPLVNVFSGELKGANKLGFSGNDYWSSGAASHFDYGSTYGSLSGWASATGQEKSGGVIVGSAAQPAAPAVALGKANGTTSNILSALTACKPFSGSIAIPSEAIGDNGAGSASQTQTQTAPVATGDSTTTGWSNTQIGGSASDGSYSADSTGTYALSSSSGDIWGNADDFHYAYKTLNGNGTIIAHIDSQTADKAGIMIRSSNAAGAAEVSMVLNPNGQATLERRYVANQPTTASTWKPAEKLDWVKLVRAGNTFTGYASTDGVHWTEVGSTQVQMSAAVEIGLAVASDVADVKESGSFDDVSITHD